LNPAAVSSCSRIFLGDSVPATIAWDSLHRIGSCERFRGANSITASKPPDAGTASGWRPFRWEQTSDGTRGEERWRRSSLSGSFVSFSAAAKTTTFFNFRWLTPFCRATISLRPAQSGKLFRFLPPLRQRKSDFAFPRADVGNHLAGFPIITLERR